MAQINVQDMTTEQIQSSLASPSKGYENRAPYREALSALKPGQVLRIRHGQDETKRAVQFRIVGAAKEAGVNVKYGDDKDGDIIVWLDDSPNPTPKKSRRSKNDAETAADATNGAAPMPEPVAV